MSGRLQGKTCLISGSGGPVGRATALRFAAEGAQVVGADIDAAADAETVAQVRKAGGEMVSLGSCDLTNAATCQAVVDFTLKTYGKLDVLVNNASRVRFEWMPNLTQNDWNITLDGELTHVFLLTRAAWPALAKDGGTIVNLGSTSALLGSKILGCVAHSAAKAGVVAMTRQLAVEGRLSGIRANSLSPGIIENPMFAIAFPTPEAAKVVTADIPRGKAAQLNDIANIILFLASDESIHINGADIVADGGAAIW